MVGIFYFMGYAFFLSFIFGIGMFIFVLIKKRPKKIASQIIAISFIGFLVGAFGIGSTEKPKHEAATSASSKKDKTQELSIKIDDKYEYSTHFGFKTDASGKADVTGKTGKNAKVVLTPFNPYSSDGNDVEDGLNKVVAIADSNGIFHIEVTIPSSVGVASYKLYAKSNKGDKTKSYNIMVNNDSTEYNQLEEAEKNKPENIVKEAIQDAGIYDAKTKIEGNNLIICYPTEMALSDNSLVTITYPEKVAEILKGLQGSIFENIIIQNTTTFTDNKGNESEDLALSTFFTKATLDTINFDNWEDQLKADGTILYSVADGYMIQNTILNNSKSQTKAKIGNAGKSNDSAWWTNNGYIALEK